MASALAPRTWAFRANAVVFAGLAGGGAAFAAGYWAADPGWAIAGGGASLLYAAVSVLLWRGVQWAAPAGLGLAGFSAGLWIQSAIALTGTHADAATDTTLRTCLIGLVASALAFGLLWAIPRSVSWRHGAATAFAGAAAVPGLLFALAPAQSTSVAIAMGVGSATLLAGTVALGRGRTWGLLANLAGAAVIATGVRFAPSLGILHAAHPWLPNGGGFLVEVLGLTTAGLALLSSALYLPPILRFVLRRD